MFPVNVDPPGGSIGVDKGETKVNGTKHLPFQHLGLITTKVQGTLLQHEVTLEREGGGGRVCGSR